MTLKLKKLAIEMENGVVYVADVNTVKSVVVRQFVEKATFPLKWSDFSNEVTIVFVVSELDMKKMIGRPLLEDRKDEIVDAEILDDKP